MSLSVKIFPHDKVVMLLSIGLSYITFSSPLLDIFVSELSLKLNELYPINWRRFFLSLYETTLLQD
jgi:hypothetical protein